LIAAERGDGILASTVGVGNSPLGKIASPQDGSAVAVDWSVAGVAVISGVVAVDWSAAACWSTSAVDVGVVAVDRSTASVSLWWSASAAGVVAFFEWLK